MNYLSGVYTAAVTPVSSDHVPLPNDVLAYLDFLAKRGCHGALLLGTTGEGPSFSVEQRCSILRVATDIRTEHPDFKLLAGTGTPSLEETVNLTKVAFDLGFDGVVVLPPYYFRQASEEGLMAWFREVIVRAVPPDGVFLAYHIPAVSGVSISLDLLARLMDAFPRQSLGLKDSSADPEFAHTLGERFGDDLFVFNGTDRIFSIALQAKAAGCITAAANLISPQLRAIWDAHQKGFEDKETQDRVNAVRNVLEQYSPLPPTIKALLARHFGFPRWESCPPLTPLPLDVEEEVSSLINLA